MRILFVAKDTGAANVAVPLAEMMEKHGHEVRCVVEGIAARRFIDDGFVPDLKLPEGFPDGKPAIPVPVQAAQEILKGMQPDVVVVTISRPDNLEPAFAEAAGDLGIKLVYLEDLWGNSRMYRHRNSFPAAVLTLDEYGVELVRKAYPSAAVFIVGNAGASIGRPIDTTSRILERWVRELQRRYDRVYFFAGGGINETPAEISFLVRCLRKTEGNWCLIPGWHPKAAKECDENGRKLTDVWNEKLAEFGDRIKHPESPGGDVLAQNADATIASVSTLLTTAAHAGKTAISLQVEETLNRFRELNGHDVVPQVALGAAHAVEQPCDLSPFGPCEEGRGKIFPYQPKLASDALEALFKA